MRVLIVDDSIVFRTQISSALSGVAGIVVVGTASHGKTAVQKMEQIPVDVVILDLEMPEMDGIAALREIRKRGFKTKVIIFSSQTQRGAESALLALREGADDIVVKPGGENLSFERASQSIEELLIPKILQFYKDFVPAEERPKEAGRKAVAEKKVLVEKKVPEPKKDLSKFSPSLLVIGSSTGGPTALEKIFESILHPISIPILIVQHMPPVFTDILAKKLGAISGIRSEEAKAGEFLEANRIYVAPGDYHLSLEGTESKAKILLTRDPQRNSVRPAVDTLFEGAAQVFGPKCLGAVLTGMGEDGLIGAKAIRQKGGAIVIQDKASSVVFGMPGAIFAADEYDKMTDLEGISLLLNRVTHSGALK